MTAKRFTLAYETNDQHCIWWAIRDGDITLWKEEVAELLNDLVEENEDLKTENKKLNERIGILEGSLIDKGFDIND